MRNSKIKVAFFAEILQADFDGASRTMTQIIDRIPSETFEFLFICGVGPKKDIGHKVIEIPTIRIPFNQTYKMALPFLSERFIKESLQAFDPDIIHIATPSPLGHFGLEYGRRRRKPVMSIYHTHFLSYVDYYLKNFPLLVPAFKNIIVKNQKKFYDRCDKVYMPTQSMISALDQHGFRTDHMDIWQRGIDKQLFSPKKKDITYFRSLANNDKPNILYASRLVWEKNLKTLAAVYQRCKELGEDYNFIIAGDGVAEDRLRQLMPEAYFVGKLDHEHLAKVYASADVFLFPSISETYGNVVIEAMASGLPCVIGNGGGTAEHIIHGLNGFKCPANDAEAYVEGIKNIVESGELKDFFVQEGLAFVKDLCWDKLVQRYFDELRTMVHGRMRISA